MTLTIDANFVWKSRHIFKTVAPIVDNNQDFEKLKTALMRVLSRFPDAWQATVDALEELRAQPWPPIEDVKLRPSQ